MSTLYYKYQAFDIHGKVQNGQLNADSEKEAVRILQGKNLTPVQIQETRNASGAIRRSKISHDDVLDFTNGLTTLVEAHVPIDRSLRLLEGVTESAAMRELVIDLLRDVKEGKSLAEAMENHPRVFSKMYVNIVRAGEEGGILHDLLPDLAEFLETSAKTRQAVISAMIYPVVLLITGIISVVLLLIFVVPQFAAMFEDAGTDIPASAAFLLSLSGGIQSYGFLIIVFIVALAFLWKRMDSDPASKLRKDNFLLSMPMVGSLILYKECAVFSRTLGSLLGAGIPLIRALRVAREVIANTVLTSHLSQVEEDVRGGAGLGNSLEKTGVFPTLLHQLVAVGEESGRTSSILLKLAKTFDTSVRNQMSGLVAALQPALIIFLAIAVGGITITMLSAVFSMNAVEF
ncbi:MAG: type II secretion system F family protein [Gammaproteobacteria bacterium]|jgi:general secretion pathway protein F|nr:type II secretion system F family protein [Gammaproteobacteria bacterium]MBT3861117.1 type II secretion system F family protein [Gammaproteobacteria bacterium]MBT3987673.1 type II secretion system F family protein [Gammaproteobacteria bacterium]MBT4657925.1 type II secretion system F family protein [Gammaproteobacteria bacterium]MBT4893772.1 type II secretion system F family protein [Gammaproteobacteria bacterium]